MIQKCAVPHLIIIIMKSQLSMLMEWFQNTRNWISQEQDMKSKTTFSKNPFSEVINFCRGNLQLWLVLSVDPPNLTKTLLEEYQSL